MRFNLRLLVIPMGFLLGVLTTTMIEVGRSIKRERVIKWELDHTRILHIKPSKP